MSAREAVLSKLRRSMGVTGIELARQAAVEGRLCESPSGVVPKRGHLPPHEQVALFAAMVESVSGTVDRVVDAGQVPGAIAAYLRQNNLPQQIKRGDDPWLAALPWEGQPLLQVERGHATGDELVGLSRATFGVAETGTLVLTSGPDNPTTLNFLPETHIVCIRSEDIVGDYETAWGQLRGLVGKGQMPRTVNWVTGPSRSGDIEQTILLGAHGPRSLHVVVVG